MNPDEDLNEEALAAEAGSENQGPLWTEQAVNPETHVAVIHDSFGERYVNYEILQARAQLVTVLRILGAMDLEPKGTVQYFLDGAQVNENTQVSAGSTLYIVGKLAGGR
jgi:hypothetical protein